MSTSIFQEKKTPSLMQIIKVNYVHLNIIIRVTISEPQTSESFGVINHS